MRDKLAAGAFIGLLADAVKLSVNYLLFLLGATRVVFWQIVATRFLPKADLLKPSALLIGGAADIAAAALLGAAFVYILHYTGKDYLWLKGIGFGLAVWAGLLGMILETARRVITIDAKGIIVTLAAHLVFGLALSFWAGRIYHPVRQSSD